MVLSFAAAAKKLELGGVGGWLDAEDLVVIEVSLDHQRRRSSVWAVRTLRHACDEQVILPRETTADLHSLAFSAVAELTRPRTMEHDWLLRPPRRARVRALHLLAEYGANICGLELSNTLTSRRFVLSQTANAPRSSSAPSTGW